MSNLKSASSIGGFFEIELPTGEAQQHPQAWLTLASGRACLRLMMSVLKPAKVWVPFYICDSILRALFKDQIAYDFYALTEELELEKTIALGEREYILYVNYFGLKTAYATQLTRQYGPYVLLDLTQAFFEKPPPGQWAFNSARKFFGVPDGAYLYAPESVTATLPDLEQNQAISLTHLLERHMGRQEAAYVAYTQYEEHLNDSVKLVSAVSKTWLSWLDYQAIAARRQANYHLYQQLLQPLFNELDASAWEWLPLPPGAIPFCYPLRLARPLIDRQLLFKHNIFAPWLWPEMRQRPNNFPLEKTFVDGVLALPLDHRYGISEIQKVVHCVTSVLKKNILSY